MFKKASEAKNSSDEVRLRFFFSFFEATLWVVLFFGQAKAGSDPNARSSTKNEKKIFTKQKFVAEPDIENKGTQNSLFFVNAQRETSFQRDDSVDWFAFNSRGWICEGRFSSFSQCA